MRRLNSQALDLAALAILAGSVGTVVWLLTARQSPAPAAIPPVTTTTETTTTSTTETTTTTSPSLRDDISGKDCDVGKTWRLVRVPVPFRSPDQSEHLLIALGWGCGEDMVTPSAWQPTTTTAAPKAKKP